MISPQYHWPLIPQPIVPFVYGNAHLWLRLELRKLAVQVLFDLNWFFSSHPVFITQQLAIGIVFGQTKTTGNIVYYICLVSSTQGHVRNRNVL